MSCADCPEQGFRWRSRFGAVDDRSCIVVGLDASPESLAALEWGLLLGASLGRRVVAVHAVGLLEGQQIQPDPDIEATVRAARMLHPDAAGIDVETVLEAGPAPEVIVRVAEREHAALIAVGSRGLGEAPRLLGSTSEGVLAHAHLPVFVIPAGSSPSTTAA
jgi:nucleotide-binding universal stress UspA family protein